VDNQLLEVAKHADQHHLENVGLREVTQDTRDMSKQAQSTELMVQRMFGMGRLGVGIAEHSI
jgi:hypothetical protein